MGNTAGITSVFFYSVVRLLIVMIPTCLMCLLAGFLTFAAVQPLFLSNQCFAEQIFCDEKVCEVLTSTVWPSIWIFPSAGRKTGCRSENERMESDRKIGKKMKKSVRKIEESEWKRWRKVITPGCLPHLNPFKDSQSDMWVMMEAELLHQKIQTTCFWLQTSEVKISLFMRSSDKQSVIIMLPELLLPMLRSDCTQERII